MIEETTPGRIIVIPEPPDALDQEAAPPCMICEGPVKHLQIRTGVTDSTKKYYEGHYLCVLKAMPPEEALKAIMNKTLPVIDESEIDENGRMKEK